MTLSTPLLCPFLCLSSASLFQMEINLAGQIVVLDEAHNIEDCARESASYTLDLNLLKMAKDELDGMVSHNIRQADHMALRNFCASLAKSVTAYTLYIGNVCNVVCHMGGIAEDRGKNSCLSDLIALTH